MMRLQLTVRQTDPEPGAREQIRRFDRLPVIIGRAPACDLVLHDESRFISSNHAVISLVDGLPCVRDTSSNGVFVNGAVTPLGRGNSAPLGHRDELGVGDYVLLVSLGDAPAACPDGDAHHDDDPFAALLDEGQHAPSPPGACGPVASAGFGDDPFDPFRGGEPDWPTPDEPSARGGDIEPDWADWPGGSGDALAADEGSARDGHAAGRGGHAPARGAPPPAVARPSVGSRADDALVEALLLQCVEGLMGLLRARSEVKQAMRTDVTSLAGTDNNPLKFSRDGRDALARLLDTDPAGGYLAPEAALGQAIDDLALHQVAMLDGMKGAVDALLERFDPDRLAETLTADHPIRSTLPVARDAKLWERFNEQYRTLTESARGDFSAVFGREFRKAYEARVGELGREPELW